MCRILARRHTCHHTTKHRLSRCGATFTKPGRRGQVLAASCSCEAYVTLRSDERCGPCQYEEFERTWRERIEDARTHWQDVVEQGSQVECEDGRERIAVLSCVHGGDDDLGRLEELDRVNGEMGELEELYSARAWSIRQSFPTVKRDRYEYPVPGTKSRRLTSLLRCEVRVEDVHCLTGEEAKGGDGWDNTGWNLRSEGREQNFKVDNVLDGPEAVYWDHGKWMWVEEDPADTIGRDDVDTASEDDFEGREREEGGMSSPQRPDWFNGAFRPSPKKQLPHDYLPSKMASCAIAYGPGANEDCKPISTAWHHRLVALGPEGRYHKDGD